MRLGAEQIAAFKTEGVLALPGFLSEALCDEWQARPAGQMWAARARLVHLCATFYLAS
jgi:hypothetical protein